MGKLKKSNSKYTQVVRIKNKTRKLEKRLNSMINETSKEHVKRDCRIGRKKEGFKKEDFKFRPPKRTPTND